MSSSLDTRRLKSAIAASGHFAVFGLLLIAVSSGVVFSTDLVSPASQYSPLELVSEEGDEEPVPQITHEVTQGQDVQAVMAESSEAYSRGQVLRNEDVYPRAGLENFTLYGTAKADNATIRRQQVILRYEAQIAGRDDPFWSDVELLGEKRVENYTQGDQVVVETDLNTSTINSRREALEEEFGGDVTVEVETVIQTEYAYRPAGTLVGESDAQPTVDVAQHTTTMSFGRKLAIVPAGSDSTTAVTGGTEVEEESDMIELWNAGVGILSLLSFIGAGYIHLYTRELNIEKLEYEIEQSENKEWVTVVDRFERTAGVTSSVMSLSDLVDLAIDNHGRVVYCCTEDMYFFSDGNIEYVYEPLYRPAYADAFEKSPEVEGAAEKYSQLADGGGDVDDGLSVGQVIDSAYMGDVDEVFPSSEHIDQGATNGHAESGPDQNGHSKNGGTDQTSDGVTFSSSEDSHDPVGEDSEQRVHDREDADSDPTDDDPADEEMEWVSFDDD